MTIERIVNIVAGSGAGIALLIVMLVILYNYLRRGKQNYPYEDEIEAFILPYIYKAIMSAYKTSETIFDAFGERLEGADKARIAASVYDLLPEAITLNGTKFPIKVFINQEQFTQIVERVFAEFLLFYNSNCDKFGEEVERWLEENDGPEEIETFN